MGPEYNSESNYRNILTLIVQNEFNFHRIIVTLLITNLNIKSLIAFISMMQLGIITYCAHQVVVL